MLCLLWSDNELQAASSNTGSLNEHLILKIWQYSCSSMVRLGDVIVPWRTGLYGERGKNIVLQNEKKYKNSKLVLAQFSLFFFFYKAIHFAWFPKTVGWTNWLPIFYLFFVPTRCNGQSCKSKPWSRHTKKQKKT